MLRAEEAGAGGERLNLYERFWLFDDDPLWDDVDR